MDNKYWTYHAATDTPTLDDAKAVNAIRHETTHIEWDKLTPGMKREIVRMSDTERVRAFLTITGRERAFYPGFAVEYTRWLIDTKYRAYLAGVPFVKVRGSEFIVTDWRAFTAYCQALALTPLA